MAGCDQTFSSTLRQLTQAQPVKSNKMGFAVSAPSQDLFQSLYSNLVPEDNRSLFHKYYKKQGVGNRLKALMYFL